MDNQSVFFREPVKIEKYNEIRVRIDEYLRVRFKYRSALLYAGPHYNQFLVDQAKICLGLTLLDHYDIPTMAIDRIGFNEVRKGHGRHLLNFLAGIAIQYGYGLIEIRVCGPEAQQFATRLGFRFDFSERPFDCRIEPILLLQNSNEQR